MLNYKILFTVLGQLLFIESFLFFIAFCVGLIYHENMWLAFGFPLLLTVIIGFILILLGRGYENKMSRRDGFFIVAVVWILFSAFGMLPFTLGGYEPRLSCSFFESMSGFTTTGATIFTDIDHLPHAINFWRCMSHWIGGIGIVFFTIAVLPNTGVGELKLFSTESSVGKLHPRIKTTAHWIGGVYLILTLSCIVSLYFAGMNLFDAVCHAFSAMGTGGFSTHQDSIAYFHSPAIEYVLVVFMILAGTNFSLLYLVFFKRSWSELLKNGEWKLYMFALGAITLCGTALRYYHNGLPFEKAFRSTLFHVASIQTTTGFTVENFTLWHPVVWCVAIAMMAMGGSSGATCGGLKSIRILTIMKVLKNEFKLILHPHAVLPLRVNKTALSDDFIRTIFIVVVCYFGLAFSFSTFFVLCGVPFIDAISCCCSALSGVGPGLGTFVTCLDSWNKLPDAALWGLSFLMLAGRLEFFSLLVLFFPSFWRDN